MQLPALNGTTIYANQLSNYFKAPVIASNALDWKAVYKKGKTHNKGFRVVRNPLFNNSSLFVKFERLTKSLPLINSIIHGPLTPAMPLKLLKSDWDIVHSLTLPFYNNYIAMTAAKLKRRKCAITPFFIKGVVPDSYSKLLKNYDLVLACTEYEKKCLNELGLRNVHVIPMSVNPKPFEKASGSRFRKTYGISDEERIVLFVGHANLEKGAYSLLEAALRVKARFVFMGAHTPGFKSRIKSNNVLLVNPQLKNKFDAFAACDVYAMPSRVEAFGITYLEAWASKKPVIAADNPVSREVIGNAGLLVNFGDTNALIKAINNSFEQKGLAGYNKLVENYSEDKVMSDYMKLLKLSLK